MTAKQKEEFILLGLTAAARILGVVPGTVKGWADDGLIRCMRDSARRRLFFPQDIENFKVARQKAKRGQHA